MVVAAVQSEYYDYSDELKIMKERKAITMSEQKAADVIKGNEAEEFIKKIVMKVIATTVILVVGVGIAVYYTSGAV